MMPHVSEPLPPTCGSWKEFRDLGLGRVQPWHSRHLGSEPVYGTPQVDENKQN